MPSRPVGKISQVDPGKYVDEENNVWTGTADNPVYGGAWTGAKPTQFVDVPTSPNSPTPPPPPPPAAPGTPPPAAPTTPPTPYPSQPSTQIGAPAVPAQPPVFQTGGTATKEQQVAEFYRTLLGRDPENADVVNQWIAGTGGDLAQIQTGIAGTPEAQAYSKMRSAMSGQAGGTAQPTAAYLQSLIAGGMSPQEAIAKFNKDTGRTTGNEAVYYGPEVHGKPTIGLPGEYLSQEGNGWQITARQAEAGPKAAGAPQGLTYADVLAKANAYASGPGGWGRALSDADIAAAKRDLGFTEGALIDPGQLPVIQKWIDAHKPAAAAPTGGGAPGPAGAPPGPTAGGNPSGSAGTSGGIYNETDTLAGFREAIMKRLRDINAPVDENSAQIREPMSAARNEAQRTSDSERTALAERLYAGGGLNTQGIDQGIQQSAERNAVGLGSLKASLITREYDARRQDLQNMLAQATASGDNASARAIQQELAQLQATLTREGFGVDLAKFQAYLNQNAAINGLGN